MDLWKARKRYRRLAQHLRKGPSAPSRDHLESQLLSVLLRAERFETELSIAVFTQKTTAARLRRSIEWLEKSAVLSRDPPPLVRTGDAAALVRFDRQLQTMAAEDLRAAVLQLAEDLRRLDARVLDLKERIRSAGFEANGLIELLDAASP